MLEDELCDPLLGVDDNADDVAEVIALRGGHGAVATKLDVALRDPVIAEREVRVIVDRLGGSVDAVEDIVRIAAEVNDRPRKTLAWQRPAELFAAASAAA